LGWFCTSSLFGNLYIKIGMTLVHSLVRFYFTYISFLSWLYFDLPDTTKVVFWLNRTSFLGRCYLVHFHYLIIILILFFSISLTRLSFSFWFISKIRFKFFFLFFFFLYIYFSFEFKYKFNSILFSIKIISFIVYIFRLNSTINLIWFSFW